MSSMNNTALYCDENLSFVVRQLKESHVPGDGEVLIETIYSGVNPADAKHATLLGIYPAILGYDFCGRVLKAPTGSKFQLGDLVAGYTPTGVGRPAKYGTHQKSLVCPEDMLFSVPSNLPPHHAACLGVVTMTACDALYNIFKFPLPAKNAGANKVSPLVIWGASSSVGLSAVQLARASGIYPILVTASPKHHPLLLRLGATRCFDYRCPHVASNILSALEQERWGPVLQGFDTVGSVETGSGPGSAQLMAECVSKDATLVSVVVQKDPRYKMPFATPNRDATIKVKEVPHPITIPARKADYERAWKALQWAVAQYGSHFQLPSVEIFNGSAEEAMNKLLELASHGRGLGKLVLEHPLQ
ncbi:uncharacterized protein N7503_011835 [Penicillium pulvis]|uniref:uncharacterized protein n=1 Tax=Penicillium pulvis TaxID=1562058 RepID=UPI002548E0DF|nr:uncharacterized protein N7503_011835 [Penicillium pulvis]KAJ5786623.1 hypothetical protein N7503_011835 [Penicillium pulvis]